MREKLELIEKESLDQIANYQSLETLDEIRVTTLGKKGRLTGILRGMGELSLEEEPKMRASTSEVRARIEEVLAGKREKLENDQLN